jgi:choline dehydrogenase
VGNFSNPVVSQPSGGKQYATILGALVAPTSRGNVTIASNDTSDLPIINPNWLSTEADQQIAIAAYKRIRGMFHSTAMAPIVVGDEYFPGSQYQTDAEILEVIRNTLMTIYHAACTCKMGTRDDPMAVLDSRARVFGVDRLRVVDASAFPILPPGHPQSTVCKMQEFILLGPLTNQLADMLAEKIASDIISSSSA